MNIGLLQCDDVGDSLQPKHGNYPEMFGKYFSILDSSVRLRVFDVRKGQYPAALGDCDAYLTTGSQHGLSDGLDWVERLKGFVRRLDENKVRFVGICFGHQLLAEALGGSVERSPLGWGVGFSENRIVVSRPWMRPVLQNLRLLVSHQDQVSVLPDRAELFAGSDFCPYYMYGVGEHMLGVQGHPEFTPGYARDLMRSRLDRIPPEVVERAEQSLQQERADYRVFGEWMLRFFGGGV